MQRIFSCVAVVVLTASLLGSIKAAEPEKNAESDTVITVAAKSFDPPKALGKRPVSVTLDIPKDKQEKIAKIAKEAAKTVEDGKFPEPKFGLLLEDFTFEQPHVSGILVFLNVPEEMLKGDEWKKLDAGSPYCTDAISLYAMPSPAERIEGGACATEVIGYLSAHNQWKKNKLSVTVIRSWSRDPKGEVIIPDEITDMSIKGIKFELLGKILSH